MFIIAIQNEDIPKRQIWNGNLPLNIKLNKALCLIIKIDLLLDFQKLRFFTIHTIKKKVLLSMYSQVSLLSSSSHRFLPSQCKHFWNSLHMFLFIVKEHVINVSLLDFCLRPNSYVRHSGATMLKSSDVTEESTAKDTYHQLCKKGKRSSCGENPMEEVLTQNISPKNKMPIGRQHSLYFTDLWSLPFS